MKKVKLSTVKDGKKFKLGSRKTSVWYTLQSKKSGAYIYTSDNSGLTYSKPGKTIVYVLK